MASHCSWCSKYTKSSKIVMLLLLLYCHSPHRTVGILLCGFALAMAIPPSTSRCYQSILFPTSWPGLPFSFYCHLNKAIWTGFPMPIQRQLPLSELVKQTFLFWNSYPLADPCIGLSIFQLTLSILRHTHSSKDRTSLVPTDISQQREVLHRGSGAALRAAPQPRLRW